MLPGDVAGPGSTKSREAEQLGAVVTSARSPAPAQRGPQLPVRVAPRQAHWARTPGTSGPCGPPLCLALPEPRPAHGGPPPTLALHPSPSLQVMWPGHLWAPPQTQASRVLSERLPINEQKKRVTGLLSGQIIQHRVYVQRPPGRVKPRDAVWEGAKQAAPGEGRPPPHRGQRDPLCFRKKSKAHKAVQAHRTGQRQGWAGAQHDLAVSAAQVPSGRAQRVGGADCRQRSPRGWRDAGVRGHVGF